jgi:alpha-galactosidase/6-phospho-beta-glucosidase family protein
MNLCDACLKKTTLVCSRCRDAYYCSIVCQKKHWLIHKGVCLNEEEKKKRREKSEEEKEIIRKREQEALDRWKKKTEGKTEAELVQMVNAMLLHDAMAPDPISNFVNKGYVRR